MHSDLVRKAALFSALTDEDVEALRSRMTSTHVARGSVLFREGERGDRLYVIVSGKLKLGRTSVDGRENLVSVLGPGELLGELAVFDPGDRNATATAISNTELIGLSHDELTSFIADHPQVAKELLASLARRLRRTNETLADLVFTDVPGRVAKALIDLADRFGQTVDDGILVPHDLTQEELAQLVGASRETVNKALADFVTRGWIRLETRAVVIYDIDRLTRRAH